MLINFVTHTHAYMPHKYEKATPPKTKNANNRVAYKQNQLTLDIKAVRRMEQSGAAENS